MNLFSLAGWDWVWETINSLLLIICDWIYILINWLYQVFMAVAKTNLFTRDTFETITSRLYVIMAVAMLFVFAYNIILMIINPDDKKSPGNAGKIVKETIISFLLIILLPTIFNWMYIFQNNVLDSNIIGQVFLGSSEESIECDFDDYKKLGDYNGKKKSFNLITFITSGGVVGNLVNDIIDKINNGKYDEALELACENYKELSDAQKGAQSVAPTILSAFLRPESYTYDECIDYLKGKDVDSIDTDEEKDTCVNYFYNYNYARYTGEITWFATDERTIQVISDSSLDVMYFNGVMAIIAGGLAIWMFLCYAMEIGVRVAKLGLLQIISPIPVMMRIIPKKKEQIFDKWLNMVIKTYIDVFVRLTIIYFALFAISLVPGVIDTLFSSLSVSSTNGIIKVLASVIVILGILKFGQEAPNLIKEFFGNLGTFSLRSPKKQLQENKLAMAGMGAIGGGVSSMFNNIAKAQGAGKVTSAIGGLFGGARRGFNYGSEAKDFGALKRGIKTSQAESDAARRKHEAIRREGQINGEEIPFVSGVWGQAKHTWEDVKKGAVDFKDFLFGNVASAELGNAANGIMVDIDNMENEFSNATIAGIKSGRDEVMKNFNSDEDFKFNGRHYSKVNATQWKDETGAITDEDVLRSEIVDSYKNRLAKAYAENESKAGIIDGFKRANESMLKDLRDSMPKLGEEFSTTLFDKLNKLEDANGVKMNLNVHSLDDLEARMKNMLNVEDKDELKKGLASIYKLNDEIKSLAKGVKISNDQALKAQASNKDKKDK